MVRIHPDPPTKKATTRIKEEALSGKAKAQGAIAQLGERLLCKQEVTGSIPVGSTRFGFGVEAQLQELSAKRNVFRFAVSFIRLLFKNSEEVKRTRFSQTGFVWVVIALLSFGDLSPQSPTKRSL